MQLTIDVPSLILLALLLGFVSGAGWIRALSPPRTPGA